MTYAPNPDSDDAAERSHAALLDSLRYGLPLPRARTGAGFRTALALARACEATPGLEEACAEAEAEGRAALTARLPLLMRDRRLPRQDEGSDGRGGPPEPSDAAGHAQPVVALHVEVEQPPTSHAQIVPTTAAPAVNRETILDMAARLAREREATVKIVRPPSDALALLAAEAATYAPGDFGYVLMVDARCIAHGMPAMSPWWRYSVGAFYASGKQWGIFLVGRGGGKSTTLERVAAAVARYGARKVPPGQTWTWPFISVGPDDANRRISGIAAVFRAAGLAVVGDLNESDGRKIKIGEGVRIARAPRGSLDLEDVRGNSIQLGSIAGTVGNVSGPSTIGLTIDEAAKLIDARGANPLTEIVASAAQTSRGREGWRAIMSSSAFDRTGIHFQMIDAPPNDVNFIATIGPDFIDAALDGFERVAAWEQRRGDTAAAKIIRSHAASLRADSPLVPTWVANPTLGNPRGLAWDGAALATRMLVEVLPDAALDGVPRINFWLRECGSLPMDRGGGFDPMRQMDGLADRNARLAAAMRGETTTRVSNGAYVEPMKIAGAPPGDTRYAGPTMTPGARGSGGWDSGPVF